jgi:hypothetical protein
LSSISPNGSPDPDTQPQAPTKDLAETVQPLSSRPSMGCILAALVAVALAVYIGLQVIGVLFSIASPPQPPRPENARQIDYTSTAYGVDEWIYTTQQDACEVTAYYESLGAMCSLIGNFCNAGRITTRSASSQNVAQCSGELDFSIFATRWNAVIATGYGEETPTHFRLSREIFWTGNIPPTNFYNRQPTAIPSVP